MLSSPTALGAVSDAAEHLLGHDEADHLDGLDDEPGASVAHQERASLTRSQEEPG